MPEDTSKYLAQTSPFPLNIEIEKAEGNFLYGPNGEQYLDLIAGIAVNNIGHRHPKVLEAIREQSERYMHVMAFGEYLQSPQLVLSEKLISLLPDNLEQAYFVNSGTEANEAALKLAKRHTGRREIVSFLGSYHGSTHGSLSVSGNNKKKQAYRPLLPDISFIRFNEEQDLTKITESTAAVIVETIQGDAGVRIPSKNYMRALRDRCDRVGALLILDEIQTGFGRCGSFFAFEQFDISPDIVTMAKAMGGGMPIGAFVSSVEIMSKLTHDPMLGHITTFGGHPVNCAAAIANIEVLENESLIPAVESKGQLFQELLVHEKIKEVRRAGLMMAVEFESADIVEQIVKGCIAKGIITFWFLSCPESFRLAPPLTITEKEIRQACEVILQVVDST